MKKYLLLLICTLVAKFTLTAQTQSVWEVPANDKLKVASFKFTEETKQKGSAIFAKSCLQCHGAPTTGTFAKLNPLPGDVATEKFSKQLDGELFFKITTGRGPMLSFKETLTEEERWTVISYIRSFHKDYKQPEPVKPKEIPGKNVKLIADYQKETKKFLIHATGELNGQTINIAGAAITLSVKRYFGNLQIDKAKFTTANGIASFEFPSDLPGSKEGDLQLVMKFSDEAGNFPALTQESTMKIGIPTDKPSLTDTRAMWTVRSQAPIWLILLYGGGVLIVFGIIGYILKEIGRIRTIKGKE